MPKPPLVAVLNADLMFIEMISELLREEGYDAIPILESARAFDIILEQKPDLVFIELLITNPEAGLMILNKMRLHPRTTQIPVIIASTITQLLRDNEEHLRSKGCELLPKPFDLEELLTIIGKFLPAPS